MAAELIRSTTGSIHWFRKGLRLHDNPSLLDSFKFSRVYPVFCIDPYFAKPSTVGVNRYNFLLESLNDLDSKLRDIGLRLFVVRGKPEEELPRLIQLWNIDCVTYEYDTEPYAKARDSNLNDLFRHHNVQVISHHSHTLNDLEKYYAVSKGAPLRTYQSFQAVFDRVKLARASPLPAPTRDMVKIPVSDEMLLDSTYDVPTLRELGYSDTPTTPIKGGETEALKRLAETIQTQHTFVRQFSKPDTSPNSLLPSTTVLSPYIKFGCLSATLMYTELDKICCDQPHTKPPVSLHGQLLWREFFYYNSVAMANFDKMESNPFCRKILWERDIEKITAWKEARTGFPFIDAIMTQLRQEGWIHHLARHAVACFLTRGDLWQHWEEGVKVFDLYLLDDDWALNNANWQWLSCSNFFYQYFRIYSPVAFGKKTDPEGNYIRKWLPKLARFPTKFIFEPWKAPLHVQQEANCIVGIDYPEPIVNHDEASKINMKKMEAAYASKEKSSSDRSTAAIKNLTKKRNDRSRNPLRSTASTSERHPSMPDGDAPIANKRARRS